MPKNVNVNTVSDSVVTKSVNVVNARNANDNVNGKRRKNSAKRPRNVNANANETVNDAKKNAVKWNVGKWNENAYCNSSDCRRAQSNPSVRLDVIDHPFETERKSNHSNASKRNQSVRTK